MLGLTVQDAATCTPLRGASVEIWQCDASGHYSEYSEYSQPEYDGTGQTFLRGVQTTDSSGRATFRTIYPGWYSGRATHIHVEVYVNGASRKVTQVAFPESISASVYATGVCGSRGDTRRRMRATTCLRTEPRESLPPFPEILRAGSRRR